MSQGANLRSLSGGAAAATALPSRPASGAWVASGASGTTIGPASAVAAFEVLALELLGGEGVLGDVTRLDARNVVLLLGGLSPATEDEGRGPAADDDDARATAGNFSLPTSRTRVVGFSLADF